MTLFVEELRKEKRDEVFCGKRVRLGEDDNLEYEFTASDVMRYFHIIIVIYCKLMMSWHAATIAVVLVTQQAFPTV